MARKAERSSDPKDSPLPKLSQLPRGPHHLSPEVVEGNYRERLLAGATKAVEERGFAGATVTDIVRYAEVSRHVFYEHFATKAECIEAAFGASLASLMDKEVQQRLGISVPSGSDDSPASPQPEPPRLPRGRHGLPLEVIQRAQRERLLAGAAKAVEERGLAKATVRDIMRHARIARRTFYEHFADREECLKAAFGKHDDGTDGQSAAVAQPPTKGSTDPAALARAQRELISSHQRERLLAGAAKAVEERGFARVRATDIIREAAVSGKTFYEHFANKEECIEAAFGAPFASLADSEGQHRFGSPVTSGHGDSLAGPSPDLAPLPAGRHGIPRDQVSRNQRERLLAATAKAVEERGFAKVRVSDIVRHAAVSRRTFYEHFANRDDCLAAARGISLIPQSEDGAS